MAESMTTYVAMLKEWYTSKRIINAVYKGNPLLAMLPKEPNISGETWDVPIIYGDPQAGSATFSTAQANKGNVSTAKWQVTMKDEYSFAAIGRKVIKASRDNKGAFLPAVKPNVDGAINTCRRSLAIQTFGDGSGAKSRISSINDAGTNGIVTLTDQTEAVRWQKGEKFQLSATKTGGSLRDSGAQATILAINRSAGTITVSGKLGTAISGAAANDYMYRAGDYDAVLSGLGAWIPTTAPTAGDSFYGMDRSVDADWLAGVRYDGSDQPVHEALIDGVSEISTIGDGEPDHIFVHPKQFRRIIKELSPTLLDYKVSQDIGFKGFTIQCDNVTARVFSDRYCPTDLAYALQLDTWELGSMGPIPEIFDADTDQEMLREGSSDGYEVRVGGYPNIACRAPGYNGVITLPAVS